MINRALFRLLPFLCLLVLAASAKKNDSPSRRMSSPGYYGKKELNRRLKGMVGNNNKDESSAGLPPMPIGNDWRRLDEANPGANTRNRHELRFLKKKSSTKKKSKDAKKSKRKTKKKDSTSKQKKSKTTPTSPPTVAATRAPTSSPTVGDLVPARDRAFVPGPDTDTDTTDDDGLLS